MRFVKKRQPKFEIFPLPCKALFCYNPANLKEGRLEYYSIAVRDNFPGLAKDGRTRNRKAPDNYCQVIYDGWPDTSLQPQKCHNVLVFLNSGF
jgi:hypothetical protein